MGTRGDLPLALRRVAATAACALTLTGCVQFDFLEPDLPESGAPVVFQANVYIDETGTFRLDGSLVPGLNFDGFRRTVLNDTIGVSSLDVTPSAIAGNGTRTYAFPTHVADPVSFTQPLIITPPVVADVGAVPPVLRWYGLNRVDGDSLIVPRGAELMLRVSNQAARNQPGPQIRQWFLELATDSTSFRLGGSGEPPDTIRVPAYWIPPSSNGRIAAYLTYYVAGTYRPFPGDYLLIVGANMRLRWNIRLQG